MSVTELDQKCPGCGHAMSQHSVELGCEVGWDAAKGGCACGLSLALQWGPRSEHGGRRYT